jgi:hypothetical protein
MKVKVYYSFQHRHHGQIIFTKDFDLPFMPTFGVTIIDSNSKDLTFHIETVPSDFKRVQIEYYVDEQACCISVAEVGRFYNKEYIDDYIDDLRGLGWDCSDYDKIHPEKTIS